jgi:hypothetical protein
MAHGSVARAVMNNDVELAKVLIERLIGGSDYLAIRDGRVILLDPVAFARDAEQTKREVCARRALEHENNPRLSKRGQPKGLTALIYSRQEAGVERENCRWRCHRQLRRRRKFISKLLVSYFHHRQRRDGL